MRFKRNESFRYEFESPIDATFKIVEVNGVEKNSNEAEAKIENISPHGMKLLTNLDVQLNRINSLKAEFQVTFHSDPIVVRGKFLWQRKELQGYSYGIEIDATEENEKLIIEELKKISKGTVYVKK
jgi:hypothetical protein